MSSYTTFYPKIYIIKIQINTTHIALPTQFLLKLTIMNSTNTHIITISFISILFILNYIFTSMDIKDFNYNRERSKYRSIIHFLINIILPIIFLYILTLL